MVSVCSERKKGNGWLVIVQPGSNVWFAGCCLIGGLYAPFKKERVCSHPGTGFCNDNIARIHPDCVIPGEQTQRTILDTVLHGVPDTYDAAREKSLRTVPRSDIAAEHSLTDVVKNYLHFLTQDMEPGTNCERSNDQSHIVRQRMLSAFGQCTDVSYFHIRLSDNDSVENWMELYATAIRCSIAPCERGFVFLDWEYVASSASQP